MIRAPIFLALAALTCASVPASAAPQDDGERDSFDRSEVGTRFKIAEEPMGSTEMRRFQKKVARCLAKEDKETANKILENSDPANIDYRAFEGNFSEVMDAMNFDRCMVRAIPRNARGIRVRIAPKVLRNLLAEEVYLRDQKNALALSNEAPEFLENRFFAGGQIYPMAEFPAKLADCVVAREPKLSHEFLKSNPTSSGERELAESLSPVLGACLPDDFAGLEFTMAETRAFVADGLWSRRHYGAKASVEAAE